MVITFTGGGGTSALSWERQMPPAIRCLANAARDGVTGLAQSAKSISICAAALNGIGFNRSNNCGSRLGHNV
jgi:hypothetical protein